MNKKNEIYFGLIEKACVLGLKKWEPLNISWSTMRSHGIIKAENYSNWLTLYKNIIQSIVEQNGRVLIINRYHNDLFDLKYQEKFINGLDNKYQDYELIKTKIDISTISFNNISPHIITKWNELNNLESFIFRRSKYAEYNKRILYIPTSISFDKNQNGEPIITSLIRDTLNNLLGSPNKADDYLNEDQAVPILILTIGEPWYADEPIMPTKLRAIATSSFHLHFSSNDLNHIINDNSSTQLFIFNTPANSDKVNGADGFVHYKEDIGPPNFNNYVINSLFKV
jgi:hypothetical protein